MRGQTLPTAGREGEGAKQHIGGRMSSGPGLEVSGSRHPTASYLIMTLSRLLTCGSPALIPFSIIRAPDIFSMTTLSLFKFLHKMQVCLHSKTEFKFEEYSRKSVPTTFHEWNLGPLRFPNLCFSDLINVFILEHVNNIPSAPTAFFNLHWPLFEMLWFFLMGTLSIS